MSLQSLAQNLVSSAKKSHLLDFCIDYDVEYKSSWKKEQLAAAIEKRLLEVPEILTEYYSYEEFFLLEKLINAGGTYTTNDLIPFIPLIGRGLVSVNTPEKHKFVITLAENFRKALAPKIQSIFNDTDFIIQNALDLLALGIVNRYGILSETEMRRKFNHYSGQKFTKNDIAEMILSRDRLSGDIRFLDIGNRIYYHTEFMFQPKSILKEVNTRKDLDYPLLPMEEILQCGSRDYFPENKATAALLKELNKRKVSNPKELVRTAYIMLQNDLGIQNIIQLFSEHIEFSGVDDVNVFLRMLLDFSNTLPQWVLKGNSSEELFREEKKFLRPLPAEPYPLPAGKTVRLNVPKVGRNDPCPCGSGKKYKHCCGVHH